MKPVIDLQSVVFRGHGGSLSLSVETGQNWWVRGPSGIGKTSLLRVLAGLEPPFDGIVERDHDGISYVFQEPRLVPGLSVLDNLRLLPDILDLPFDEGPQHLVEVLDLAHLADRPARLLSGGEKQRVNIARALLRPCDVLLLDEAGSNLDVSIWNKTEEVIAAFVVRHRATIVQVSHQRDRIVAPADGSEPRILDLGL